MSIFLASGSMTQSTCVPIQNARSTIPVIESQQDFYKPRYLLQDMEFWLSICLAHYHQNVKLLYEIFRGRPIRDCGGKVNKKKSRPRVIGERSLAVREGRPLSSRAQENYVNGHEVYFYKYL
ncbi:hypothetical protein EVAR_51256_1 [Eumeta japonica]|uniref:Uncharacterized protein n=1 Tax=Eumeta variegata TaxID=151549 RepID=A0A4C1X543_EUMVA|nr:hypothetical protein EVAR_51256_1 [Eumeta japonica]